MNDYDVCVRGGGAVGSSLALALAAQGWRVAHATTPRTAGGPDVRTYALNARSVALLERLRVWTALPPDAACAVGEMRVAGDAGGRIEFNAWEQCEAELAWIVDAAALDEALAQALRYCPGVTPVGTSVEARLQAVCEGARSTSRDEFGAGFERLPYPQSAVAARLVSDTPHAGTAWQWFRPGEVLALLPFHRPEHGRSFGLVWSVPHAEARRLAALDDGAFDAALQAAIAASHDPLDPVQPGRLGVQGPRAVWPLALGRARRWCGPGWVLLGDAAHQVHPLAGQGLNLGLADVDALSRTLATLRRDEAWRSPGDERVLRRYERERAAPTRAMAGTTDALLHLFAQPAGPVRELRNLGLTLLNRSVPAKRWLIRQAMDHRR